MPPATPGRMEKLCRGIYKKSSISQVIGQKGWPETYERSYREKSIITYSMDV
jgi:hypothetical protein